MDPHTLLGLKTLHYTIIPISHNSAMTNPTTDAPTETLNPNSDQQPPPTPHSDPHSSQPLQIPDSPNPNQRHESLVDDSTQPRIADDPESHAHTPATTARRASKRKKTGAKRIAAQKRKFNEKFQVIVETLKPIPFVPAKALDFESHKSLLERLGLWNFVHIEFDSVIRTDLIAQLIASYSSVARCSYVNDVKIMVNRADLCRALKLPKKNSGSAASSIAVDEVSKEDIAFLDELVSNWILFHDDTVIMTKDVMQQMNLIKDGNFEKVDWAGLMWSMLEKELKSTRIEDCYYASHLQHLIKTQHKELLEETPVEELEGEGEEDAAKDVEEESGVKYVEEESGAKDVEEEGGVKEEEEKEGGVKKEEEEEDDGVKEEEEEEGRAKDEEEEGESKEEEEFVVRDEVDGSGDVRMGEVEESQVHELEEHNTELSLGQDNVETLPMEEEQGRGEQMMDFEQSKEEAAGIWFFGQSVGEPSLRQCHNGDMKGIHYSQVKEDEGEEEQEQEEDEDAEEDEHDGGFHLSAKYPLEGMPSGTGSPIQTMEAAHIPFGAGIHLHDNSVGDFLSARDDRDHHMIPGSSLFGNGYKRDLDLDNHNSHHNLSGSNKRLRSDSPWSSTPQDFEGCMEQIQHCMGKARMLYASKDRDVEESTMNQQVLLDELQKRDNMIDHLHKTKMEENQKSRMEVYRLEKELYMMQSLVEGYRKAFKETQKAFAEYRARCPQADEPLYKDVPGSGGLVLSVMEIEKERLKKEEEERIRMRDFLRDFEKNCKDIEGEWMGQMGILKEHLSRVESLGDKLQSLDDKVKYLKELNAKCKISDPLEVAPASEAEVDPASEAEAATASEAEAAPASESEAAPASEAEAAPANEAEAA